MLRTSNLSDHPHTLCACTIRQFYPFWEFEAIQIRLSWKISKSKRGSSPSPPLEGLQNGQNSIWTLFEYVAIFRVVGTHSCFVCKHYRSARVLSVLGVWNSSSTFELKILTARVILFRTVNEKMRSKNEQSAKAADWCRIFSNLLSDSRWSAKFAPSPTGNRSQKIEEFRIWA